MTNAKDKPATAAIKDLLSQSPDGLREIVRAVMQEMLEAEMTDALQAGKGERTATRLGYRSGYYSRTLVTRVGKVELLVADDHAGLRAAIREVLSEAAYQRCYVHFLRNALDHLPRKADDDCLRELRWIYDRRELAEAKADLAAWLRKWSPRYDRLTVWVEENVEETFTYYRLPRQHHKHMKSTNMLERVDEEIKRRTRVVRIFPNAESCLRLVRALAVETHENWREASRYLSMDDLKEQKKLQLREAA